MARRIMLIPISTGVGLTSVSVGLVRALEQKALKGKLFQANCSAAFWRYRPRKVNANCHPWFAN